jgi:uncharacterized low-complexity protein
MFALRSVSVITLTMFGLALGGCAANSGGASNSESEPNDALFQTPSGDVTPDSIYGVWGGVLEDNGFQFDSRMQLAPNAISFSTRCQLPSGKESAVASVTARARISEDEIAVLESKTDERKMSEGTCRAFARPATTTRCTTKPGLERRCFTLEGTRLVIYADTPYDVLELTKLSD